MSSKESVYDALLQHLEGMLFQIPVMSFIDRHCAVFDPTTENCPEYEKIWEQYKELVSQLLDGFREDCGVTHEQIIKALKELDKNRDFHEVYKSIFEQVFATVSVDIFIQMMTTKNVELQHQVLMVLLSQSGQVPGILQSDDPIDEKPGAKTSEPDREDDILEAVLRKSKAEYDALKAKEKQSEEDMIKALKLSKLEAENLQHMHKELQNQLHVNLATLTMNESQTTAPAVPPQSEFTNPKPDNRPKASNDNSKTEPLLLKSRSKGEETENIFAKKDKVAIPPAMFPTTKPLSSTQPEPKSKTSVEPAVSVKSDLPPVSGVKQISGAEAAANWLATAMSESDRQSSTAAEIAANMPKMSREELLQRQQYLKTQRDKLIALKQKERENHLKSAEKKQPTRPQSARAARSAMKTTSQSTPEIDEKQLAMRKTIADRLKKEVIVLDDSK
ncbi:uncharacterized protein LOC141898120 [Tubulanus polymorphus]|uniref:uncharacterized protein LOC141898120 n=1 Tax=Tubulanus polymorphus TaxID=672921 RepID=UPI003DA20EA5